MSEATPYTDHPDVKHRSPTKGLGDVEALPGFSFGLPLAGDLGKALGCSSALPHISSLCQRPLKQPCSQPGRFFLEQLEVAGELMPLDTAFNLGQMGVCG